MKRQREDAEQGISASTFSATMHEYDYGKKRWQQCSEEAAADQAVQSLPAELVVLSWNIYQPSEHPVCYQL